MAYGAALMLGWTALLVWAARRPEERRAVAALTVIVIYGLIAAEVPGVGLGVVPAQRLVATWCLQAVLLGLFAAGYHGLPQRRRRAVRA